VVSVARVKENMINTRNGVVAGGDEGVERGRMSELGGIQVVEKKRGEARPSRRTAVRGVGGHTIDRSVGVGIPIAEEQVERVEARSVGSEVVEEGAAKSPVCRSVDVDETNAVRR